MIKGYITTAAVVVSFLVQTARADFIITGPTNHVASVELAGCNAFVGLNPDPVTKFGAAALGGRLDTAF